MNGTDTLLTIRKNPNPRVTTEKNLEATANERDDLPANAGPFDSKARTGTFFLRNRHLGMEWPAERFNAGESAQ